MKIMSGIFWDKGKREKNQDSATLQQVMTGRGRVVLAAVSDGIGGLFEGQVASGFIIEELVAVFYRQVLMLVGKNRGRRALRNCILRCLCEINQALNGYAKEREIKLGATISILLIWRRNYLLFHLGDSRIYQCGRRKMRRLTTDHSDGGCGLLKCLGSFRFQRPDIRSGRIRGKKGFLLCTDGFYRRMEPAVLEEVLKPKEITEEGQIEKRLGSLGTAVLKSGEQDNISAVYVQVGG